MSFFNTVGIIASIIAIPLALVLWIYKPNKILIKLKSFFAIPDPARIAQIEQDGLIILNKELLNNSVLLKKQNVIYWPVVPTDSPNLIHAVFIKFIKKLSMSGLKVVIFVFDYYYLLIKDKQEVQCNNDVQQFIKSLNLMGLDETNYKIIFEKNIITSQNGNSNISHSLLKYFGVLTKKQIDDIASYKKYMKESTRFIRYIKPFFNMIYLANTSHKYGFTLSGIDEKDLWEIYNEHISKYSKHRVTNLYIPTMKGILSSETDVLDKCNNITFCDSKIDIENKIYQALTTSLDDRCIHYALEFLIFGNNEKVIINNSQNQKIIIEHYTEMLSEIQKGSLDIKMLSKALTPYFYKIFHKTDE